MNVAVIGTGAMGSLFAARLSNHANITMIGSWKKQLSAINKHGLRFLHPDGTESRHFFRTANDPSKLAGCPLALIAVKSWQTNQAVDYVKQMLSPNGLALTLQNGLGHFEIISSRLSPSQSVVGVTSEGATIIEPGLLRYAGAGITHIGTTSATEDRLVAISELFHDSGFDTRLTSDLDGLVWGKLVVNAGINPLTALLQVPNGYLMEDDIAQRLMCLAAEETAAVALAKGLELPYISASERVMEVAQATATNRSSMAQDIARGTPTEIEAITGIVVKQGREFGVHTPVNDALYHLVKIEIDHGHWRMHVVELSKDLERQFEHLASLGNRK